MHRPGDSEKPAPGEPCSDSRAGERRARQTLPRYRRIGRREGFDFAPGATVSSNEWFVVYVRKNRAGVARLGVTVSKRVASRATDRNFAKRLVREGFRRALLAHSSGNGCAVNVIVRVRKQLDRSTAQQGAEALARLLQGIQEKCGKY
jgi:ribonuclease P protein component